MKIKARVAIRPIRKPTLTARMRSAADGLRQYGNQVSPDELCEWSRTIDAQRKAVLEAAAELRQIERDGGDMGATASRLAEHLEKAVQP